jgi:NhaP-type Na+/H+ or K+/H+ antiporter
MAFFGWMTFSGIVLLLLALSSANLQRLPISQSFIYLLLGIAISPVGLGWLRIDLLHSSPWFEHLTEIAVVTSLFISGLKLRLSLRHPAWRAAVRLAGPVMLVTILGIAAFARFVLGLDVATSLLLGALLAPTDPVLASSVSVNNAADRDRMRYGLTGEAGLNDGVSFPFVIFALLWGENGGAGDWIGPWALQHLLWAIPSALLLGLVLARGVGRLAIWLRSHHRDTAAPSDFLAMSLIALSYIGAELIGALGFLAVFAAGVGLRKAEIKVVAETPHPNPNSNHSMPEPSIEESDEPEEAVPSHPPAEDLVAAHVAAEELKEPAVAAGVMVAEVLSFGDTAERLLEILLVVMVGICLWEYWDWRAVPLALTLFFVIRPIGARLLLVGTPTTNVQRWLMGWFGIRGIGSLYYIGYIMSHGISEQTATELIGLTMTVVALSIMLHGVTAKPLLARYTRSLGITQAEPDAH